MLPLAHHFGSTWHLYFTGQSTSCPYTNKTGLQTFWGIGLATSSDGIHFTTKKDPIILGNETKAYPSNFGIAGGGSIVEEHRPAVLTNHTEGGGDEEEGRTAYRLYYTLAVGSTSPNVKVDQKKVCAVAHSFDGVFSF